MRTVFMLAFAGLRGRGRVGLAVTVGMLALSAIGLSTGLAVSSEGGGAVDRLAARTNVADVVVRAKAPATGTGDHDLGDALAAMSGVRAVTGPLRDLETTLVVRGSDGAGKEYSGQVTALDDPDVTVNHPLLVAGRWLRGPDEIVLERSAAEELGLRPGDKVALRGPGGDVTFTLAGTANELTDCGFPQCDEARMFVADAGLSRIGQPAGGPRRTSQIADLPDPLRGSGRDPAADPAGTPDGEASRGPRAPAETVGVTYWLAVADGVSSEAVASAVVRSFGDQVRGTNTWPDTRGDLLNVGQIFGKLVSAFGAFLLVAVAVIVAGSMTSRMVARRREMALLGAVGVRPAQLTAALLAEHLTLGVVAALLGWLVAGALAPSLDLGATVTGPQGPHWTAGGLLLTGAILLGLLTLATVVGAVRAGRASIVDTLRDAPAAARRDGPLARLTALVPGRLGLLGVGRLAARPGRATLTGLTMLVAVMGAVVAGGFMVTVTEALERPSFTGDPWQVFAGRGDVAPATVEAALHQTPGIGGWWSETERRGSYDGQTFRVRALGGDTLPAYSVGTGRLPTAPGEVAVGYGLLDQLGLRVGQTATVEIAGVARDVRVVGWYRTSEDTGRVFAMRLADLRAIDPTAVPDQYRMTVTPGTSPDTVQSALATRLGEGVELKTHSPDVGGRTVIETVTTLIAGVLVLIALANMLHALLASNRESARDIGVVGALGCTPRQLIGQSALAAAVLAGLAVVIGLPLGLLVFRIQSDAVARDIGLGPGFGLTPSATFLVALVAGTLALGAATGAAAARGLARRPLGDLLRWE
ncbi:FtsX-like permease family protein [Pseudofrankia sp. BMG5.37]|uniref:ABC transporter permease n=1 Tax=Pseudofrankia sp. BMG5.37 TaxID=3050035 RepID=UPI0028951AE9|nr:FtsX-like permease family protein [Pseudofrankia sp. BMG5.37]MDT3439688.1 ABC transporter permease [Pseudofrankia sp. BMG5.37]